MTSQATVDQLTKALIIGDSNAHRIWELTREWRWGIPSKGERTELADLLRRFDLAGKIVGEQGFTPQCAPLTPEMALNQAVYHCLHPDCSREISIRTYATDQEKYCDRHLGLFDDQGNPQGYYATVSVRYTAEDKSNFDRFSRAVSELADQHLGSHTVTVRRRRV